MIGSLRSLEPPPPGRFDDDSSYPFRRGAFEEPSLPLPVPLVYWLLVLFLGTVTATLTYLNDSSGNPEVLAMGAGLAVMILPVLQLGASVLTAILVRLFYTEGSIPLRRVGRITAYSAAGAVIGMVVMCGGCAMLGGLMR